MKKILSPALPFFILSLVSFLFACENKFSGVLIPVVENGIQIGDTNSKNDTAQFSTGDAAISVFGGWIYNFTPPPNGKNERASFDFTYSIENKGKSDLIIAIKKSTIISDRIENFRQLSVTELSDSKNQGLTAGSPINSDTVTIKAGEKKIYVDYYAASVRDGNTIVGDEVIYKMSSGLGKSQNPTIKFKCISSSDIESLRREPPRPQN